MKTKEQQFMNAMIDFIVDCNENNQEIFNEMKLRDNDVRVMKFIIRILKNTDKFLLKNRTIGSILNISETQVQASINKLYKLGLIIKKNKANLIDYNRWMGTTRVITLNDNNNYLKLFYDEN